MDVILNHQVVILEDLVRDLNFYDAYFEI